MLISDDDLLERFTKRHRVAISPLRKWWRDVSSSNWRSPLDAQQKMTGVRSLGHGRLLFNIGAATTASSQMWTTSGKS